MILDVPFQEALLRYGKERQRDNPVRYKTNVKYQLQRLLNHFGDMNLSDISHAVMRDWADAFLTKAKPATVLRELTTLRAILNKAPAKSS